MFVMAGTSSSDAVSALMRSAHDLHGVLDMTPLAGLFRLAHAFASHGVAGRPGDCFDAVPLEHLPRDGVDFHLGCHLALPAIHRAEEAGQPSSLGPPLQ